MEGDERAWRRRRRSPYQTRDGAPQTWNTDGDRGSTPAQTSDMQMRRRGLRIGGYYLAITRKHQ